MDEKEEKKYDVEQEKDLNKIIVESHKDILLDDISRSLREPDYNWANELVEIYFVINPESCVKLLGHVQDEVKTLGIDEHSFEDNAYSFIRDRLHLVKSVDAEDLPQVKKVVDRMDERGFPDYARDILKHMNELYPNDIDMKGELSDSL